MPDADDEQAGMMSKSSAFSDTILSLFLFIWFIFGNYWVFRIYKPNFVQLLHEPSNWCDESVYMFAVGQIIGCYGLMGVIFIMTIFTAVCFKCCVALDTDDDTV